MHQHQILVLTEKNKKSCKVGLKNIKSRNVLLYTILNFKLNKFFFWRKYFQNFMVFDSKLEFHLLTCLFVNTKELFVVNNKNIKHLNYLIWY